MSDLNILKELEKEINKTFEQIEMKTDLKGFEDYIRSLKGSFDRINKYVLDDKENIVGIFIRTKINKVPQNIFNLLNIRSLLLTSKYRINNVPKEIGQLTNLQLLDLSSNQFSALPKEIGQLTNLQLLDLSSNQFSALPKEIGQLTNLRSLDLSSNQLSALPKEIGQLTNLRSLDLNSNKLLYLSNEISRLDNLQSLNLHSNKLSHLPKEISQLSNLKSLGLTINKLSTLPKEINQLTNLQYLRLRNNELSTIPNEIGQLVNLQSLELDNNELSNLPKEICQLHNLQSLSLSNNELSNLPKEICQLPNLQFLYLTNNNLSTLPKEISQLTNLQYLDLSGNKLSSLPSEITILKIGIKLRYEYTKSGILIKDNPIESPPIEIIKEGRQAIIEYFNQLQEKGKDHIYEAKFIIVGEPGAGKTTLAKKIMNPDYQLSERDPSTEGIDVFRWQFYLDNGQPFFMNIWDFGGQAIYHATHQFFLTKRSLYALVADARKENTDFNYWLDIISLLSDNSPLLIVKNEKDDRSPDINERQLRGHFTQLKDIFSANLATNIGLYSIIKNIKHHISQLPHIGSSLPKTWANVRKTLEQDKRSYINLDEYLKICDNNGFDDYKSKLQLSAYLHDIGVCLHFQDDPVLKQRLFLKPEWGTDAVYKILDYKPLKKNLGKFTKQNLSDIWNEKQYQGMEDELLQLMMKFQLCYEIPDQKEHYIAPQLLSQDQPEYDWNSSNNMHLRYTYEFMPKGMLTYFIVVMHKWIDQQKYVWRTGVILSHGHTKAEIIEYYPTRKINVRVSGNEKKNLMSIVMHELDKIHGSYHGLKFDKWIPCNCYLCEDSQNPYFFKYNSLIKRKEKQRFEIECDHSYEMVNVRSLLDDIPDPPIVLHPPNIPKDPKQNTIFISYSHKDEFWKDQFMNHLNVLKKEGVFDVWDDRQISPGNDWYQEIQTAIDKARVAVLLISANFLNSEFITNEEVPALLNKRQVKGLTIIPVVISPCSWKFVKWLSKMNLMPTDGQPLSQNSNQDEILVSIVEKIAETMGIKV